MRGFTVIELLIVIAIVVIVAIFSIPFVQSFQVSSDLATNGANLTAALRQARGMAIDGQNNSSWGIHFNNLTHNYALFKGPNYAGRDPSFDDVTSYPDIFTVSTNFGDDMVFSVFSGQPSANGTTTVGSRDNQQEFISINNLGLIQLHE